MTDEDIIKLALIELLIKVHHFDERLAKVTREARAGDSNRELIATIRERLELDDRIVKTLVAMPENLRTAMSNLRS
jgi:hypothetical protein